MKIGFNFKKAKPSYYNLHTLRDSVMKKAYKLKWDFSHIIDDDYDVTIIENVDTSMIASRLIGIRDISFPDCLYFKANFNLIPKYDYPLNDLGIPVCSNRMMDLLFSKSNIELKRIPIVMIDDTYLNEIFDLKGMLYDEVPINKNYSTFQLKTYAEVFDYNNSIYEEDFILPVGHIEKLVLREPEQDFQPIFRMRECMSDLFVSQCMKEILEDNKVKGCVFEEIEVSSGSI